MLLAPWCQAQGIALPSVSTIGRIIARAKDKMRHTPARLHSQGRPKPIRRPPKPRKPKGVRTPPLTCFATDTIERIRDGIRRYIVTLIDPTSRLAFAFAIPSKSARHTQAALCATLSLLPKPPQIVLSDNGSEFEAAFAKDRAVR